MNVEIGRIQAIYRYPIKSMAGEPLEHIPLGWYGVEGDRRFAFNIVADQGGFPWLTASKLPALLQYKPIRQDTTQAHDLPTHVITPGGKTLEIRSEALRDEIIDRFGADVQLMLLRQGIFDEATVSVISLATARKIADATNIPHDIRRFRPNIVIETQQNEPFIEDAWVGKTIIFGDSDDSPAIQITNRDQRCMMVNLHPDTSASNPAVMKTVVKLNHNCAGVYASVIHLGQIAVGQPVYLRHMT